MAANSSPMEWKGSMSPSLTPGPTFVTCARLVECSRNSAVGLLRWCHKRRCSSCLVHWDTHFPEEQCEKAQVSWGYQAERGSSWQAQMRRNQQPASTLTRVMESSDIPADAVKSNSHCVFPDGIPDNRKQTQVDTPALISDPQTLWTKQMFVLSQ